MLELKNIHKYYNPGTVNEMCLFSGFNLTVNDGDFISIIGSNGSGKTSLLNIICGSIPIENGSISIHGKDLTKARDFRRYARIGRVFQNPAMGTCPTMTILENMSLADNKGHSFNLKPGTNKKRLDAYREMLSQLGLGPVSYTHLRIIPDDINDGQKGFLPWRLQKSLHKKVFGGVKA